MMYRVRRLQSAVARKPSSSLVVVVVVIHAIHARAVDNQPLSRARERRTTLARATHRAPRIANATHAPFDRIAARTQSTVSARATPARTDANANAEAAANAHDVVARRPVRPRAGDAGAGAEDDDGTDDASFARSRVAIIDAIGARVGV